jgi:hypothetical protein
VPKRPRDTSIEPHRHSDRAQVLDGAGMRTSLTPELLEKIVEEMRVGDWPQMAAYRAGISPNTFSTWVIRGCDIVAVDPYKTLVSRVVQVEAEISGKLMKVLMDHALGNVPYRAPDDPPAPSPETARWLLLNRFRFLWQVDKETGKGGGISITEAVERQLEAMDEKRRERARAIINQLPEAAKQVARKDGFLL